MKKSPTDKLLTEINKLIIETQEIILDSKIITLSASGELISKFSSWSMRVKGIIKIIHGNDNGYLESFNSVMNNISPININNSKHELLYQVKGILEALKYELENGLLIDLKTLLQADFFSDFLEMGEYFLTEGYKDAAAVIIGGVLEKSLKEIAIKNEIPIAKPNGKLLTINPLNDELTKKGIYTQLEKKQITSWADLRNSSAHGNYENYTTKDVELMLKFVTNFCSIYQA